MLKTSKLILAGVGVSAAAVGIYFVAMNASKPAEKGPGKVKRVTKVYDTVPEKDSSLEALNKILRDNQEALGHAQEVGPVSVEIYENIDKNSRLYDSLVAAGYIEGVEDEVTARHSEKFEDSQSIKADKFIGKKMVNIHGDNKTAEKDSMAGELAHIKPAGSKMTIEFWESPVNYKGYRLGRDKMIVFGVIPDDVRMVKYNGDLYLVTINNIYEVGACTDFCQLRPIKDKTLLANIMRHAN